MFLSPLGERLGEGVEAEVLWHPLTQPLPQGGGEEEEEAWRSLVFDYS
jgi:hypothetical protein